MFHIYISEERQTPIISMQICLLFHFFIFAKHGILNVSFNVMIIKKQTVIFSPVL